MLRRPCTTRTYPCPRTSWRRSDIPWHKVHNHSECDEGEWAVVKDSDGSVAGCHDSEAAADAQIRALYASESEVLQADAGPETAELAMVAVYPRAGEAAALAVAGGLEVDDLHVTLIFLGDANSFDPGDVHAAVSLAALVSDPMEGTVGGRGVFGETPDGFPSILLPDVQGLTKLREDAASELRIQGIESPSEHGFLPHMTLTYADEAILPDEGLIGAELHFDTVSVVIGDRRTDYPLGGFSEEESTMTATKPEMTLTGPWGVVGFSPPVLPAVSAANAARALSVLASTNTLSDLATITVETDAPTEVDAEPVRWEGVLALEGIATDDNMGTPRIIMPEAMTWRPLPIPLMAIVEDKGPEHAGQKLAGRIDEIWRVPRPDLGERVYAIMGRGVFDSSEEDETGEFGRMIGRLVREKTLRGVSIDPVATEWALVDGETLEVVDWEQVEQAELAGDLVRGRFYAAMTSAAIGAATVCPLQALEGATIEILVASVGDPHVATTPGLWILQEEPFVACAAGPLAPPAEWFEDPKLSTLTPVTVTEEGRVFGHIATWDCHMGNEDRCMRASRSRDGYARFHTGGIVTAEGEHLRVGRIQVKPHAPRRLSIEQTIAYYSDAKTVGAFVRIYEDQFGIACAGVTRSDAPPELLRDFYANPPSIEQRRGELLGVSCVPLPGLPVAAPEAYLVASVHGDAEVEVLRLPPVTEELIAELEREVTEADVFVAAAALQGPEALAALIAE